MTTTPPTEQPEDNVAPTNTGEKDDEDKPKQRRRRTRCNCGKGPPHSNKNHKKCGFNPNREETDDELSKDKVTTPSTTDTTDIDKPS